MEDDGHIESTHPNKSKYMIYYLFVLYLKIFNKYYVFTPTNV